MKKLILPVILCAITSYGFSQTEETRTRAHEIGIDVFDLAIMRTIDVTYEYVKNPNIGFGLTARYCFDSDSYREEIYGITPFFRVYFFNKMDYGSKGFYAESFLKLFGVKNYDYNYSNGYYIGKTTKVNSNVAFGVGLGYKYVNHSGFILDINGGIGRSFKNSNYSSEFTMRGSILFGYRF